jgi:dienelactone hydrolase
MTVGLGSIVWCQRHHLVRPMLDHEIRCWAIDRPLVFSDVMVLMFMSLKVLALLLFTLCPGLVVFPSRTMADASISTPTPTPSGSYEKYGTTSTGVDLYWTAYSPADRLRHPAVLVLHPGGYSAGVGGPRSVAQDLGNAGFLGLAVEYRLAPPHDAMDSPAHPVPGQNDVQPVDDGHYPEQTTDIQMAMRAARRDPRCDGRVYCIGGSAGGSHTAYMAATGTPGDDMPDLAVMLSCGVSNLGDPVLLSYSCGPLPYGETCPHDAVMNYVGRTDHWPDFSSDDLAALTTASPHNYLHPGMPPLFILMSSEDSLGIPTSTGIAAWSYYLDGTLNTHETNVSGGLIPGLQALFPPITESTSATPEAGTYKKAVVPVSVHSHAFEYWDLPFDGVAGHPTVATTVINWLQAGSPTPPPGLVNTLLNVSTRAQVLTGDSVLIGGFIITGNVAKTLVLRALGPSLADAGVPGVLADPTLALYDSSGALLQQNDNWTFPLPSYVVAAGLTPKDPAESLIATTLPPGSYTAVLQGTGGFTGIGLVELYDLDPANSRLSDLSSRGHVATGDQAMIGGFIIGGTQPTEILVRALGPSLTALGISGALPDPLLELHGSDGSLIADNDNWRDTQEAEIIATGIPPSDDKESAILNTLAPGNYTAIVRGVNNTTGVALVEVYNLTSN